MNRYLPIALSALTFACSHASWAVNSITTITPGAAQTVLVNGKATVKFTVSGQNDEASDCGIVVNYGDKDSPDSRTIGKNDGVFPREFEHTFNRAGQFTVLAKGERVKQTFGCSGQAATSVNIVEPTRASTRPVAAACPDGWQLSNGSLNRQTGAFTCSPLYPQQRMECGSGLRYFEKDNMIGCRARGGNQR